MANVILGLLMLWPQSLYELTKSFGAGASLFYSASTGSIKRALDRLVADELIVGASWTGPRGKRVYTITEAGRDEFRRWMLEPLRGGGTETAILARTYFLGLLSKADRCNVAENIRARIRQDLSRLEDLAEQLPSATVPEGLEGVAKYQLATLQYGLSSGRTALSWAEEYLRETE